jgi:chromate reductase
MTYTIISGSSRKHSTSLRVSRAIKRVLEENGAGKVHLVNFEKFDIPFFNGEALDPGNLSPFQQELTGAMKEAGSIIIVTPEYNWFPSAELVNMLHRLGDTPYAEIWQRKVFSLAGVSSGRGGRMPAIQLGYVINKLINVFGFESVTNPRTFEVQFGRTVLAEDGSSLGNEEFDKGLKVFVKYLIRLSEKW